MYISKQHWQNLGCPTCGQAYKGQVGVALGEIGLDMCQQHSTEHAAVLENLGVVYGEAGDNAHKLQNLQLALQIKEQRFGHDHVNIVCKIWSDHFV